MKIELKKWNITYKYDLIRLCNAVNRNYLSNRLPYPYTESDAEWWLNHVQEMDGTTGLFRAVAADGKIIGNISVEQKTDVHCKDAEIGYMLDSDLWSRGIMTEAVKQICQMSFEQLDLIRLTGLVYKPNTASQKVLEKNNFILEGIMKNAVYKDNNIYDLCIYGKYK